MKNNITVFLEIYNEEHRLKECLENFTWAEELVVFVKKSSDNSLNIAKIFATHVYEVDYCSASENIVNNFKLHDPLEWVFYITASSKIDKDLVHEINKLTSNPEFSYDVIGLPYEMFVFNLSGKFSPWYNEYKYPIIRKNSLKLSTELHKEIGWIGSNIFKIDSKKTKGRFKHFTHNNPDDFFNKHIRYVKYEANEYKHKYKNKALNKSIIMFIKSIAFVFIKRKTVYKGKNGFILSMAYISYYLMLMVFVWFNSKDKNTCH